MGRTLLGLITQERTFFMPVVEGRGGDLKNYQPAILREKRSSDVKKTDVYKLQSSGKFKLGWTFQKFVADRLNEVSVLGYVILKQAGYFLTFKIRGIQEPKVNSVFLSISHMHSLLF